MTGMDPQALRRAFGTFMTGVTVVTALRADGTPVGFTANSFTSVSMDPPMLLVCPGKFLSSFETFASCTHFAVNILAEGQEAVSNTFASSKADRFAQVAHRPDLHGVPLIDGAAVQFSCTTQQIVPAGDHCVLIGQVVDFSQHGEAGLGYVGGQYFSLGLERAAFEPSQGKAICGAIVEDGDHVLLVQTPDGLRPPHSSDTTRQHLIAGLKTSLTQAGITAELGQVYSVFDSAQPREHHSYFLATGRITTPNTDIVAVPIPDLSRQHFASPAIARMMTRFALEARSRNFALYLGDADEGAVHAPNTRT